MKERLMQFIGYLGMPVYAFEKNCGLSNGYIHNISRSISTEKLEKITNAYPQLSTTWLMSGKGEMLIEKLPLATSVNVDLSENKHVQSPHYEGADAAAIAVLQAENTSLKKENEQLHRQLEKCEADKEKLQKWVDRLMEK